MITSHAVSCEWLVQNKMYGGMGVIYKKKIGFLMVKLFLCTEIVIFALWYFLGVNGWYKVRALQGHKQTLLWHMHLCKKRIHALSTKIDAWEQSSFYKEKRAREELQMARSDEIIYHAS